MLVAAMLLDLFVYFVYGNFWTFTVPLVFEGGFVLSLNFLVYLCNYNE